MAIDHTLFALKRFTGTCQLNSRRGKSFTTDECNYVDGVMLHNNILCVPVALVQFTRSSGYYVLTNLDLSEHTEYPFAVVNTHTSNSTSDVTTSIDVLYAPEYMVNGDLPNPIFKKISFRADSIGMTVNAGSSYRYGTRSFQYSIPEGYIPFGLTKFRVPGTSYFAFNTIDIYDDSQYIDLIQIVNTYSGNRTIESPPEIEVTFIRADMMDTSLKKHLYQNQIGDGTWINTGPARYASGYYDFIDPGEVMVGDTVTATIAPQEELDPCYNYTLTVIPWQNTIAQTATYQGSTCTFTMPECDVTVRAGKALKPPFTNVNAFSTASATISANSQKTITKTNASYSIPEGYLPVLTGFINSRGDIRFARVLTLDSSTTLANIRNNTSTNRSITTTVSINGIRSNLIADIRNGETVTGTPYFLLVRHTATYSVNSGKYSRVTGQGFTPALQDIYTLSGQDYRPVGIVNMYSGSTNVIIAGVSLYSHDMSYYTNCVNVKNDGSSNASSITFILDVLYAHPGVFANNFIYKRYNEFVENISNNGTSSIVETPIRPFGLLSCATDVFKLTNDEYVYAGGGVCSGVKLYPTSDTDIIYRSRNESGSTAAILDSNFTYTSFINDNVASNLALTYDYCTITDINVSMINNTIGLDTPSVDNANEFNMSLPYPIGPNIRIPIMGVGKTVIEGNKRVTYMSRVKYVTGSGVTQVDIGTHYATVSIATSTASIDIVCEPYVSNTQIIS